MRALYDVTNSYISFYCSVTQHILQFKIDGFERNVQLVKYKKITAFSESFYLLFI